MAITIISQPSALALSGNLGKVELDTGTFSGQVTFQLCIPGSTPNAAPEIITTQIYSPDSSHRIVIDLSRIISEQLSFNFQPADITRPWQQTLLARTFYFTAIENANGANAVQSDNFTCIRAGIDNLQESVAIWLTANFLTWQPTVKRVTYSTPEFLTYYAQDDCTVHVRIYYPDGSDPTDHTLAFLTAGAWTIPVSYSVIAALLELTTPQQLAAAEHLPGAYDIWIEDSDSNRLTYIQRYLASTLRENEQWVLFENSLGGIDCFRAYGQGSVETEHQHQTAEIDNDTAEYRIDTTRRQKRSTGWLDKTQRRWLLDFFPASRRWLCQDGVFRPIILTDDSVTYTLDNMPAEFEFTFRYTTNLPYLNLSRLLTLPSVLDIQAPDMQSFTVPPRLVEFPRIGPSEGALIPAQLPHSDNWAALSLSELLEHIIFVAANNQIASNITASNADAAHTFVVNGVTLSNVTLSHCRYVITFPSTVSEVDDYGNVNLRIGGFVNPVYYEGSKASLTNKWKAGDTMDVWYQGGAWHMKAANYPHMSYEIWGAIDKLANPYTR